MLTFLKLGGSLITHKGESQHFHADLTRRVALEIASAMTAAPDLKLLIGHGSGSFGHIVAQKYGTIHGVRSAEQWRGFAEVATVARTLNSLVVEALVEAGLPVLSVQPSSSAKCTDGKLTTMETAPIKAALDHGLVPVIYGDVAIDSERGGTIISTEAIFAFLADRLRTARILLLGDTEGVYDHAGKLIPRITPNSFGQFAAALGASYGTDVTGGMASKVQQMIELVERSGESNLEVRIFGGTQPGEIAAALKGDITPGTLITRD